MKDLCSKEGDLCGRKMPSSPFPMDFEDKWTITSPVVFLDFLNQDHGFNHPLHSKVFWSPYCTEDAMGIFFLSALGVTCPKCPGSGCSWMFSGVFAVSTSSCTVPLWEPETVNLQSSEMLWWEAKLFCLVIREANIAPGPMHFPYFRQSAILVTGWMYILCPAGCSTSMQNISS